MIKVTFLTGEYPPMQGGVADHTAYLAQYLAQLGVESSVLISRRWHKTQQHSGETDAGRLVPIFPQVPNWGWRCWSAVVSYLNSHQPDVLHIQYQAAAFEVGGWANWLPWYLKKRHMPTPVVTTFHDLRIPYIFPKAGPFRWHSILALARHSDGVICTNREDLKTLQAQLPTHTVQNPQSPGRSAKPACGTSPGKSKIVTLIPLGSNADPQSPADFDRTVWRSQYQAGQNTLLLAYFGFLNDSKGGEELIEALALLRQQGIDARLLFIGGDVGHADPTNVAYAQRVQALIEHLGLTGLVHRTGYTDLAEVSANLLAADVVVMPYRDGVSFRRTTLIAALRHGCPVVSTTPADPTLTPEILPGENMLLAPPHDAAGLARTIAPLATDIALRKKLSSGARQLGDLFDWGRIADETLELYRIVIDGKRSSKKND